MVKGICFDLDGVYFTPAGMSGFVRELTTLCNDEQKAREAVLSGPEILSFKKGTLSEDEFWKTVNQKLGLSLTTSEYADLLVKHYEVDPSIRAVVMKSRQLGYLSLICSNNFVTRISALENKFKFISDFDATVFSYEVGVMKPDFVIFRTLVEKSGLQPQEIVYADDKPENVTGAQAVGIHAVTYTTFEEYCQFLISQGVGL